MTLEHFLRQFASLPEYGSAAALAIAVLAGGFASAVCPCTLPVGLGMASVAGASEGEARSRGFSIAAAFFAGVVVNLTVLGALAGRVGAIATESFGRNWALVMALLSLGGALIAFAGPRLRIERLIRWRRPGTAGSFAYGFIFSLGTSIAPLLLLLAVAAANASPLFGLSLAFAFGIGRGLPFLIAGLFGSAIARFTRLGARQRDIQLVSGCALVFVSAYYLNAFLAFV